jgi:bis(5'-nucleosyl)-tetraphosphatase (symmetrical)
LLVHAGVLPEWDVEHTLELAKEVEAALQSADWKKHLQLMYGNTPDQWDERLKGPDRLRVIINALTRVRFCDKQGRMLLNVKTEPAPEDKALIPWFSLPKRATRDVTDVFGHWSTLGLKLDSDVICLHSGAPTRPCRDPNSMRANTRPARGLSKRYSARVILPDLNQFLSKTLTGSTAS